MKQRKNCRISESGVSEIVGALILISMIVLVVAVIAAGMINRPSADKVPQVRFSVVNTSSENGYSFNITHVGGDEIPDGEYAVFLNNGTRINSIAVSPSNSGTTWSIGKTLVVNTDIEPGLVSVYYYGKTVNNPTLLGQRSLGDATVITPTCLTPTVIASGSPLSGNSPLTVQFTGTSTIGTPSSWSWNFGDGTTSTLQNPSHDYTNSGDYSVTLTASNNCGSSTPSSLTINVWGCNIPAPVNEAGGFWVLGEGSGTSASDSSVNGNTGAITSGKWVNCPAPGRGYLIFNGSSTYVSIPNRASLSPTSQVSFEAWVYPKKQQTAKVIQKRDWDGHGIGQSQYGGWQASIRTADGISHVVSWGGPTVSLNTWSYLALTYDGASLKFYVNGVLKNETPVTGNLKTITQGLTIGSDEGNQKYFNGSIANVAMYPRALTKCEIEARYASFTPQGCVPVTNFIANPTSGSPPLAVQFTDTSTGTPASWNWNFGDGSTPSTIQHPSHTYSAIGNYTVILTTTNAFGSSTATKSNYIQVTTKSFVDFIIEDNVFVYGTQLRLDGNYAVGPDATIVITGPLTTSDLNGGAAVDVTTIYVNGDVTLNSGSASLGSVSKPGTIYVNGDLWLWGGTRDIYGDVYVARNFHLKNCLIHGNVYVNGDLELGWGEPTLDSNAHIYYTGTFTHPAMSPAVLSKCIKQATVPGFNMPDQTIPPTKSASWYASKGYLSGGTLTSGMKIFAGSYSSTSGNRPNANNVIIVASNGDITLTGLGSNGVTGVLFAPYGKVTFEGGFFEGVVIARDGFFDTSGGTHVTFKNFATYFSSADDYPF